DPPWVPRRQQGQVPQTDTGVVARREGLAAVGGNGQTADRPGVTGGVGELPTRHNVPGTHGAVGPAGKQEAVRSEGQRGQRPPAVVLEVAQESTLGQRPHLGRGSPPAGWFRNDDRKSAIGREGDTSLWTGRDLELSSLPVPSWPVLQLAEGKRPLRAHQHHAAVPRTEGDTDLPARDREGSGEAHSAG